MLIFKRSAIILTLFWLVTLIFLACPEPTAYDSDDCGPNQILVDGECECEEGYYWNADSTTCWMDTTSHDFTWEALVGGTMLTSYFNGVEIIGPDDIWAVGELFTDLRDSITGKVIKYNAAHYDGIEWSLKRLTTRSDGINGGETFVMYDSSGKRLFCVFKADDELWFMGGGKSGSSY